MLRWASGMVGVADPWGQPTHELTAPPLESSLQCHRVANHSIFLSVSVESQRVYCGGWLPLPAGADSADQGPGFLSCCLAGASTVWCVGWGCALDPTWDAATRPTEGVLNNCFHSRECGGWPFNRMRAACMFVPRGGSATHCLYSGRGYT